MKISAKSLQISNLLHLPQTNRCVNVLLVETFRCHAQPLLCLLQLRPQRIDSHLHLRMQGDRYTLLCVIETTQYFS